jgi:hypothetical protein
MDKLMKSARFFCAGVAVCVAVGQALATNSRSATAVASTVNISSAPEAKTIPIAKWLVDTAEGNAKIGVNAASGTEQKAASDPITVFRPLSGCRLYDSRSGNPSALGTLGGSWLNNAKRVLKAGGRCGIPTSNVAGLSLAINVYNWSNPATGRIAMMPVGASIAGNQVGFTADQWFWTAANVKTSDDGYFEAQILDITAELIIDVNGYYQIANQAQGADSDKPIAIAYSGSGLSDAFSVYSAATTGGGAAIAGLSYSAAGVGVSAASEAYGGAAFRIRSGRFAVENSDFLNAGSIASFRHVANSFTICSAFPTYSIMKHASLDNNPSALIFLTPVFRQDTNVLHGSGYPQVAYFVGRCNSDSPTTGHWYVFTPNSNHAVGRLWNVWIINQ